jgi:predicted SPOUT superfamily RNA methylase MTH1
MHLSVAIPASIISDIPHLREKTSHIGMIGRALAIFCVDEVIVYPDRWGYNQRSEMELISTILSYMETPQYLRRYLFPMMLSLKYAGILPPLRTPHHQLTKRIIDLKDGETREGVVIKTGINTLIDIGVEHPISLNERTPSLWKRITVRIHKDKNKLKFERVERPRANSTYWGYEVNASNSSLGKMLRSNTFDLAILTSRYGKPLTETCEEIRSRWRAANRILIAFGSPRQGLREILEGEGFKMDDTDALVVNTIPKQGVETVRTEEAVYATLAVINIIV